MANKEPRNAATLAAVAFFGAVVAVLVGIVWSHFVTKVALTAHACIARILAVWAQIRIAIIEPATPQTRGGSYGQQ